MKKLVKVLPVVLMIVMIAAAFAPVLGATDPSKITIKDSDSFNAIGGKIIGLVQAIGSILAVVVLVILGIKYMMGSAEEKADYKKTMIPYLIGAILVFAASNIAGMVFNFANTLSA